MGRGHRTGILRQYGSGTVSENGFSKGPPPQPPLPCVGLAPRQVRGVSSCRTHCRPAERRGRRVVEKQCSIIFLTLSPGPQVSHGGSRLGLGRPARLGGLLDVQSLDGEARSLFVQGLSASSRSSYAAGKRRYLLFCARANLNPLPATEATLCRFVAHLSTEGLRAQSISGYLSAVRYLSIEVGLPPLAREGCPRLAYVLKGVSRSQAALGRPRRLPITPEILLSLKAVWESGSLDSYSAWLLWAMSLSVFLGAFGSVS